MIDDVWMDVSDFLCFILYIYSLFLTMRAAPSRLSNRSLLVGDEYHQTESLTHVFLFNPSLITFIVNFIFSSTSDLYALGAFIVKAGRGTSVVFFCLLRCLMEAGGVAAPLPPTFLLPGDSPHQHTH